LDHLDRCRILFGLFASCIGSFCFIPLPFEIESPLPQDVSGFQGNRNAAVLRPDSRRAVRPRAGHGHRRTIGVTVGRARWLPDAAK
jgi:hypothetical protein